MNSIWVYPGQGAQKINMLHELPIHKLVKQYLEQASDVLKQDVLLLDQPENLRSNYAVQLCLYLSGIISSALLTEQNIYPDYVAGLSIGAWAAATVAGVISFEDGLKLVARRGELMQQAYPQGYGMTAVIGTDRMRVEQWISQVRIKTPDIYIANINASNQIVISGSEEAMQQVSSLARLDGAIVKRLAVSVPSHCILLEPQARQLYIDIKGVASAQPKIKYLSGTSARLLRTDVQILDDLTFNMSRMIDWESTVQAAWERGVRLHIEALPGTVLTGLARKIFKEGSVLCFQNTQLDSLITAMQKEQVS
ncbi:malonate decarboxylase subunit epsilon [Acinetobacter radioresistens]|jgi:malonate decarboxylase epsilon subunit|uniref:Malonyl CoA-acyl carrier protein transacylase n=1 Tax=Acinetobacter radioresistens SK82 TaxID=596318 RepID=A0ABM9YMT2_ACIRA|nr:MULTISPECIES: malonate decarboxylase subunit epsilon [Acinetobacter]EET82220.1 malonate decarboxylase, epsilon subunit [Acinetobacter radioresistens SK82]EEY87036.1 malonate decarboxylase, epsilon subunit [Acinetobacter radioresistens SH164]ENV84764.1 malonate decarboxylase, epsilon subunit [Acinetobacter radioresistens NIPH 2130]EXB79015.1 malonate decarboxylase, epsilon subunit [Acinetobacter sp. 272263]EXE55461.1 malonate decarboxylase, epsilon subunit [Acinetobacter sp. 1239920]